MPNKLASPTPNCGRRFARGRSLARAAVRSLAKFTHRSPDSLSHDDLRRQFEYLVTERQFAPASVRLSYNGIRFLYLPVLDWHTLDLEVVLPKRAQRIPELLRRGTELAAYAGHPCPMCRNGHLRVSAHLAPVRPDPG